MHHVTWSWSEIKPLPKISPLESLTNPFKSLRFSVSLFVINFFFFLILILWISYSYLYVCMRKWVCVVFFCFLCNSGQCCDVFCSVFFVFFITINSCFHFLFLFCLVAEKMGRERFVGGSVEKNNVIRVLCLIFVSTLFPLNFSSLLTFLWWMLVWM